MGDCDRASFVVGWKFGLFCSFMGCHVFVSLTLFFCLNNLIFIGLHRWLSDRILEPALLGLVLFPSLFTIIYFLYVSVLAVNFWLDEHGTLHLAFQFCSCRHVFGMLYTDQRIDRCYLQTPGGLKGHFSSSQLAHLFILSLVLF